MKPQYRWSWKASEPVREAPWVLRSLDLYPTSNRYKGGQLAAHRKVRHAIAKGLLDEPSKHLCVDCGKPAGEYDHRDYSRPLDVEPVCRKCNLVRGSAKHNDRPYFNGLDEHGYFKLGGKRQEEGARNLSAKSTREFMDEHWINWEIDSDVRKYHQELSFLTTGRIYGATSFQRGLYDWFGVERP